LGAYESWTGNAWTERGSELEPQAVKVYEFLTGNTVTPAGFVWRDARRDAGASPDGLVGGDGGVEIKCPDGKAHLQYLSDGTVPRDYVSQVFGSIFICKRDWWDFCSYHPKLKFFRVRTLATDPKYMAWQEKFSPILDEFCELVDFTVKAGGGL
jgi:hypothetical protein